MSKLLSTKQAAEILGVHPSTVRGYADAGKIKTIRTPGGQRRYILDNLIEGEHTCVGYCRVSSPSQRNDLEQQLRLLREQYPNIEIVKDTASALNYKRKGLKSLLGRCLRGEKLRIVVTHRDRLARFGFELIEWIVNERGSEIVVLEQSIREPERELSEDLLTIIHVFSCRLYGMRNYKSPKNKDVAQKVAKEHTVSVLRQLSVHLQQNDFTPESGAKSPQALQDQEIPRS